MVRRQSKSKRRRIAQLINWKRTRQPGYSELERECAEDEKKNSDDIRSKYKEYLEQHRSILTRTVPSRISFALIAVMGSIAEYVKKHPVVALLFAAASFFFFSWQEVFITVAFSTSISFVVWDFSNYVLSKKRKQHEDELKTIDCDYNTYVRQSGLALAKRLLARRDNFVGYPPDWKERRLRVFQRDSYACRRCARVFSPEKLQAHHIVGVADGGTCRMSNLMSLCASCHGKEHGLRRRL